MTEIFAESRMKIMLWAASGIGAFLVAGCGTKPPIKETTTVFVGTPSNYLAKCPVLAPPAKAAYLEASNEQKEKMLTDYADKQITSNQDCNARLKNAVQWNVEQEANYESKEGKP